MIGSGELERFVTAQDRGGVWKDALHEIAAGKKRTHWMWFIFPQLRGLGSSAMSDFYGLSGAEEAAAYWAHPALGGRLREMCGTLLALESSDATEIFGWPDDRKLQSCMTLFACAVPEETLPRRVLDRFFDGRMDRKTLLMLEKTDG